jgi:hypothetical protein
MIACPTIPGTVCSGVSETILEAQPKQPTQETHPECHSFTSNDRFLDSDLSENVA